VTIKLFDGSSWVNAKSFRILHTDFNWYKAKQAWIFNGSNWTITYPEFPLNTSSPTLSVTTPSYPSGRIGCQYLVSVGSWDNSDPYIPTSYSYQWQRSGVDVAGQTNNTYQTTADDVEKIISCRVTATNNRGSTSINVSAGTQMLPIVNTLSVSDTTATPTTPSVNALSVTGLSYTGSWSASANATTYDAYMTGTYGTPSYNYSSRTVSGTGTAGTIHLYVRAVNTTYAITSSWNAAPGAVSYDVYVNGSYYTNTTSTSYVYYAPDTTTRTFTIYPRSTNLQGYGIQYGTAVGASAKYSSYGSSGDATLSNPKPVNISAPTLSPTGSYTANSTTLTFGVGSWSNSPTSYDLRLYRGTPGVIMTETLVKSAGNVTSSTYLIPSSDYDGTGRYYYRSFASATNSGGTSDFAAGTEGGPLQQPIVAPGTPTGVTSYASGQTAIVISWNAVSGASSYDIYYYPGSPSAPSDSSPADFTTTSTSYTNSGLSAGTTRYYWVRAVGSTGLKSPWSSYTVSTTDSAPTVTKPTISVSNAYSSPSGTSTWTLSMTHTGGSVPTSFDWGIQFSNSNGGTVLASSTGSGTWTAGSGGTQTVTRNSSTYSWARWVSVTATNSGGTSTAQSTAWA
jgi:hypothetical protein